MPCMHAAKKVCLNIPYTCNNGCARKQVTKRGHDLPLKFGRAALIFFFFECVPANVARCTWTYLYSRMRSGESLFTCRSPACKYIARHASIAWLDSQLATLIGQFSRVVSFVLKQRFRWVPLRFHVALVSFNIPFSCRGVQFNLCRRKELLLVRLGYTSPTVVHWPRTPLVKTSWRIRVGDISVGEQLEVFTQVLLFYNSVEVSWSSRRISLLARHSPTPSCSQRTGCCLYKSR